MKYVLLDSNNTVVYISDTIGHDANGGVEVDNGTMVFAAQLVDHVAELETVPENVVPQKYCYTTEDGFVANSSYLEPPKTEEERIFEMETQILELQTVIADMITNV